MRPASSAHTSSLHLHGRFSPRNYYPSPARADQVVAKCLAYDDEDITIAAAATLSPDSATVGDLAAQEDDLGPLLDLPDPDASAAPDDALTASADSGITEVGGNRNLVNSNCFDIG